MARVKGSDFELTAEQKKHQQSRRSRKSLFSSTVWERGLKTGVEFRWYQTKEIKIKALLDEQRAELQAWRTSDDTGQAHIKASNSNCNGGKHESELSNSTDGKK